MRPRKKAKRFFYHYYKQYDCMSIHYQKQCMRADDIRCNVPTETHWKKTQPRLVVRGFAKEVSLKNEKGKIIAYIN